MLTLHSIPPANGKEPDQVIIYLHGYAENGQSRAGLSLARAWQPLLPNCELIFPDAPFVADRMGGDPNFRQWFGVDDQDPEVILEGMFRAMEQLDPFIEHVVHTRQLSPGGLAITGFSQGAVMALHAALQGSVSPACVISYSGSFWGNEALLTNRRASAPVMLIHGDADERLGHEHMERTAVIFRTVGIEVTTVTCPNLGHRIDDKGRTEGLEFLQAHLQRIPVACHS